MKFVSNWQDLPSLLLPESVMSLLKTELVLPFEDEYSAMSFWDEVGVTLIYVEPDDVPEDIKAQVLNVIHQLIANPEFVVRLTDDYGNDSNLLIVFYVQIMPDDFVMQLHRF
ncbi:hypothetical protein QT323_16210 [Escherichia coli]|uniref:hypothetical protein n=1 Tax=Escherichia coli TaxID=562 RepID=UPI00259C8318|nr:hypothetical protein [Escherichia coli]MDM4965268.1 hypothetical protein [Escherichia coli]MDM4970208.1 hypothetical protein [Escherichia coli]